MPRPAKPAPETANELPPVKSGDNRRSQNAMSVTQMIQQLRQAGLDAWDSIEDPERFIAELRGEIEGD